MIRFVNNMLTAFDCRKLVCGVHLDNCEPWVFVHHKLKLPVDFRLEAVLVGSVAKDSVEASSPAVEVVVRRESKAVV